MIRRRIPTRRTFVMGLLLLPLPAPHAVAQKAEPATGAAPPTWAQPVAVGGVPNLHLVDDNFFRSAQPDAQGFQNLATQHGLRTVISLRAYHSDQPLARGLDLRLVRFPIHTWHIEREDVVGALQTLRRARREGPVLLHCQHGADRTGLITALYRILYQGWGKDAALDEMQNGDFGYHAVWAHIPRYIRRVNVERLRREVGVP
ncbi:MAG TPA: tyrosine-protein phosphatase [Xanthobacteraceae bacterium]|nr:tyrosine-protein phosphatase [Xanthobacteraceae bacterium]